MRSIFGELLASLAVLCALFVLVSQDRGTSSGSGTVHGQRTADVTDLLMQAIRLQRIRSAYDKDPDRIIKAQQALKDDGIYSGPVDGRMNPRMREAIRSFQSSNQLNVTGIIDEDTAQQLGLQQNDSQVSSTNR
jgi:peptidoglycan hydrolase-like protein with peptidoglycan-binding domain